MCFTKYVLYLIFFPIPFVCSKHNYIFVLPFPRILGCNKTFADTFIRHLSGKRIQLQCNCNRQFYTSQKAWMFQHLFLRSSTGFSGHEGKTSDVEEGGGGRGRGLGGSQEAEIKQASGQRDTRIRHGWKHSDITGLWQKAQLHVMNMFEKTKRRESSCQLIAQWRNKKSIQGLVELSNV